jgi:hypothetical protein
VHGRRHRRNACVQVRVADTACDHARALNLGQSFLRPASLHLGTSSLEVQPDALAERLRRQRGHRSFIRLDRVPECVGGEVKVSDCLLLRDPRLAGSGRSGIGGD